MGLCLKCEQLNDDDDDDYDDFRDAKICDIIKRTGKLKFHHCKIAVGA